MDLEANPEEIESIAKHQEVPNEPAIEIIGALKDQSGDWHLAIRHCGQLTRCAGTARSKGCCHEGPTVKKR
jgi:hypothetical protein